MMKMKAENVQIKLKNAVLAWSNSEKTTIWGEGIAKKSDSGRISTTWGCNFKIPKENVAAYTEVQSAILKAANSKWPGKGAAMVKFLTEQGNTFLGDGDANPLAESNHGFWILRATMRAAPQVFVRNLETPGTAKTVYDGCIVNALLEIWCSDNDFGKRLCLSSSGIIKVADGEIVGGGGRPAKKEDLMDLSVPDDEDDDLGDIPF